MAGDIRDGTGRDCFDMFAGEKMTAGRYINDNYLVVCGRDGTWRDGTVGAIILGGTRRYSTMTLVCYDADGDGKCISSRRDEPAFCF